MAERGVQVKADINKQGWEDVDFPRLCETCMGDNPYVKMMRRPHGTSCNVCGRPTTLFLWKAGRKGRMKRTVICHNCSKLKNACQCCLYDLTYGLPLKVRDRVLEQYEAAPGGIRSGVPKSELSLNYFAQQTEDQLGQGVDPASAVPPEAHRELLQLANKEPRYERNRPKLCSFFLRGVCTRGLECPYSHDIPDDYWDNRDFYQKNIQQSIKDRFFGTNDRVADSVIRRHEEEVKELGDVDDDSATLFISGVTDGVTEDDLRDRFQPFGEVKSVRLVRRSECAFVEFASHAEAQAGLRDTMGKLVMRDARMRVRWARPAQSGAQQGGRLGEASAPAFGGAPSYHHAAGSRGGGDYRSVPPPSCSAPPSSASGIPDDVARRMDPGLLAMLQAPPMPAGPGRAPVPAPAPARPSAAAAAMLASDPAQSVDAAAGAAGGPVRRSHADRPAVAHLRQSTGPMYPSMHPQRMGASRPPQDATGAGQHSGGAGSGTQRQ